MHTAPRAYYSYAPRASCIQSMLVEHICYMPQTSVHSNMLLEHTRLKILIQIIHALGAYASPGA